MLLTIDAGNTRTKWAIFNQSGEIGYQRACLNNELEATKFSTQLGAVERIIVSNVAGESHAALLTHKLAPFNLPVHWVHASAKACNVVNHYALPETLGADRWAALIAAWHMNHSPCVVVNAGTAVTIDALLKRAVNHQEYGEFIGGIILPGLSLMQQSLGQATAQLPKVAFATAELAPDSTNNTALDIFAKNTNDAIYAGAMHAISGAILRMARALEQQHKQSPSIIISGGNALAIHSNLTKSLTDNVTKQAVIVDNLVCQGLYLLSLDNPLGTSL